MIGAYLEKRIIPNQKSINRAAENGNANIIYCLDKHGLFPEQKSINIAAEKGYDNVIYCLGKNKLFSEQKSINIACERGHYNIISYLADKGLFPDQEYIDKIVCKEDVGYRYILFCLSSHKIYPKVNK
jgi:hypothetical protein